MLGRKGNAGLEYGIYLLIAMLALAAIQVYFKNSVMGRVRSAARDIGESPDGGVEQPYYPKGTVGRSTRVWTDATQTGSVLFGVDEGGNITNSSPYNAEMAFFTTGSATYSVNVNENMGGK